MIGLLCCNIAYQEWRAWPVVIYPRSTIAISESNGSMNPSAAELNQFKLNSGWRIFEVTRLAPSETLQCLPSIEQCY
jgi:hypothetical protein